MTHNVLDVYDRLYIASDNIKGETIDYNRGFQDAIYMLHLALKKYEHINLHIENKQLRRQLFLKELALDDKYEDRHILKDKIKQLSEEFASVKEKVKKVTIDGADVHYRLVNLEYENSLIQFYINCTQDEFDYHFSNANKYVSSKYYNKAKNKRKVHDAVIKNWFIEYYRAVGFLVTVK